jgi:tetratricopeptide (TPR) repeat protein
VIARALSLLFLAACSGEVQPKKPVPKPDAKALLDNAIAEGRVGHLQKELDGCTEAIKADPSYAEAYAQRGSAKYRLNDNAGAVADCTRALELDGTLADAYCTRGYSYLRTKNNELALRDLDRYVELRPKDSGAYYNRGKAKLYFLKDKPGAIEDLKKALELDPGNAYLRDLIEKEK